MNTVLKEKRIFSLPARFLDLLWVDQDFYLDVSKLKKVANPSNFPRNDQWADENGFHMSFALAGYSADDVKVNIYKNILSISGDGMEDVKVAEPAPQADIELLNLDELSLEAKDKKVKIHQGSISRGIARRKFNVRFVIADEFDMLGVKAVMKNGLLDIVIPHCVENKTTEVKIERE